MDAATVLEDAWAAVVASGVPEHLQAAALTEAIRLIGGSAEGVATKIGTVSGPKAPRIAKPQGGKKIEPEPEPELLEVANEDEFFEKFANDSRVPEESLRELYRVVDGQLQLALTKSALGDTETKKNQTVALLSIAPRWYVHGQQELAIGSIRDAAGATGYKPSRNLSTHIESVAGTKAVGTGAGKAIRVQGAKIDPAFAALVEDLLSEE